MEDCLWIESKRRRHLREEAGQVTDARIRVEVEPRRRGEEERLLGNLGEGEARHVRLGDVEGAEIHVQILCSLFTRGVVVVGAVRTVAVDPEVVAADSVRAVADLTAKLGTLGENFGGANAAGLRRRVRQDGRHIARVAGESGHRSGGTCFPSPPLASIFGCALDL